MKQLAMFILFAAAIEGSEIVGQWQAKRGNLPLVDLTVQEDRGRLFGTVVFHVDRDGRVVAQEARPLVDAKIEGAALTFRIAESFGGLSAFELKPVGDGTAMLRATNPGGGEAVTMSRVGSYAAGVWEGRINDLPGIELTIEQNPTRVGGSIAFFFQTRDSLNEPWRVESKAVWALIRPLLDGNSLTFEVQHYKRHGGTELGPNVKFRVEFMSGNEALLWRNSDPEPLKLTRRAS